jgi:hypothetical protein
MAQARRPTQRHTVSRSFGGRGFNDVVDDGKVRPGDPINRPERSSAYRSWRDAFYLFEEDERQERPLSFRQQYAEALIATAVVLFFVGSYTAFIVWLAVTR